MSEHVEEDIFEVVHKSEGKSRDKSGHISIETAVKGLIYRTNVYLNGFLIDAKEVSSIDLATLENGHSLFKQRYLATHYAFEQQYFMEKVFSKVLTDEGKYLQDEESECIVNTYVFENLIKNEVLVNEYEMDVLETEVEKELADNPKNFKNKYSKLHNDFVVANISIPKFPVNTFLNPTLKKFPLYDRNPMHAFYLFLLAVAVGLWIISQILCGHALPRLAKGIGGANASLVVRDMQRSVCLRNKNKKVADTEKKELLYDKLYKDGYLILPQDITFEDTKQIKTIYIKNTLDGDLIVKLNNKVIENFKSIVVTPEMLINVLTPTSVILKPGDIGSFEFKIEDSFLSSADIKEGKYVGKLIFEVIKVKYNKIMVNAVTFNFNVIKDALKSDDNISKE